jgi:hypothetical protein
VTADSGDGEFDGSRVRPLPGHAIVALEGAYRPTNGIVLPDAPDGQRGYIGRVLRAVHSPRSAREFGGVDPTGERVCVATGRGKALNRDGSLRLVSMESIAIKRRGDVTRYPADMLAIILADVAGLVQVDAIPRCNFCGPAATGHGSNMILVHRAGRMVCPRCDRTPTGDLVPPVGPPPGWIAPPAPKPR